MKNNLLRIVTNSERTTSACWAKHDYRYNLGLVPLGEAPAPLRQGSLVHRLLSTWYRMLRDDAAQCRGAGAHGVAMHLREHVTKNWWEERQAAIKERHANARTDDERQWLPPIDEALAEVDTIAAEAQGMVTHYLATWFLHDLDEWEILGVDVQLARPLVHPKHGGPITDRPVASGRQVLVPGAIANKNAGRGWRRWVYGGECDLVVRERSTGLVWIVEHKTTIENDLVNYCRKLHLDPQIRGYAWAMRSPEHELSEVRPIQKALGQIGDLGGVDVAGVLYNVLRKAVPREPALLAVPKATKNNPSPVSPGLSRDKRIVSTPAVYLAAVLRHGFNPDDYRDILEDLARRQYFGRDRYVLSDRDLDAWAVDAAWWALQVIADAAQPYHPRQVAVCQGVAPMHCPYTSICLEDSPGARSQYHLRSVRHEELRGTLADPWPIDDERRKAQAAIPTPPAWTMGMAAREARGGVAAGMSPTLEDWAMGDDPFSSV